MNHSSNTQRVAGFDIARAYAIFGMFIVNFNFCFGSFSYTSTFGKFLNLFVGNSTAIFIILAGMGLSFMMRSKNTSHENRTDARKVILKRSWFLLILGLLLFLWWPGDILHFYGGYMHIAAFMLFVPKRFYQFSAAIAIIIFHLLLLIIPIETGWDFVKFQPVDFWTLSGFIRNTFYNGWNAIFPWIAYFLLGMWMGRLNWNDRITIRNIFFVGLFFFIAFEILRAYARIDVFNEDWTRYIMSEYFPPYLPFMILTASFASLVICASIMIGIRFSNTVLIKVLSATGRMTLTHYIMHLTFGMVILSSITGKEYTGNLQTTEPASAEFIFVFATCFFIFSICFSLLWSKHFKNGPVELLMRKFSD